MFCQNASANIFSRMDCIIKTSPTHLRNPNDPARFIGKVAATEDGEAAKIHNYLDTEKIEQEALYDGMYAVTTNLLDDDVKDILKVIEGRWEIE